MTPTNYLRFLSRPQYVGGQGGEIRNVRVLQQFWEDPNGKMIFDGAEKSIAGEWRDVPLEEQE